KKGRHTEDNTELDPRNIVDFGVSAAWNNQFAIYAMYNTERSASLGLSAAFQRYEVQVGYTMPPADVRRVGIHGMDIGLSDRWQKVTNKLLGKNYSRMNRHHRLHLINELKK